MALGMTLQSLRERFYWSIGDDPAKPALLEPAVLDKLINDGLKSLADRLWIVKRDGTLVPDSNGAVILPEDLVEILKVTYGEAELTPIQDVHKAAVGSGAVTQYMFLGTGRIQLYDVPVFPYKTMELWYRAYPAPLVADGDVPLDVPPEYHEALATVYARAEYAKKMGYTSQYVLYRQMWEAIKAEIGQTTESRLHPLPYSEGWKW